MSDEILTHTAPLTRWSGERGTYFVLLIDGETAEAIAMHERVHRLEYGSRRGFGSVKIYAKIGTSRWKTSVFPSKDGSWFLLVNAKVRKAQDLAESDPVEVELELI